MDDIIQILLDQDPDLLEDRFIRTLVKVASLESLIIDGGLVPWEEAIFMASAPTKALLAFAIQKWIDPEKPIDILVGDAKNPGWTLVTDTYSINEMGRGKNPVCSGSLLYEIEPLYRWFPPQELVLTQNVGSCPLPWGKNSIMQWLYLSRLIEDDMVDQMNILVDEALEPGSNFYDMIMESDLIPLNWKEPLILSILKTKTITLANTILQDYVPDTCEVPND